jgi:site-specific recombinase XerD
MTSISIPVSIGELIDKLTILEIKAGLLQGESGANVETELQLLQEVLQASGLKINEQLRQKLKKVNQKLWSIEDDIREHERRKSFDHKFIQLARSVYIQNDRRSAIKRQINMLYGSTIVEEKSYRPY